MNKKLLGIFGGTFDPIHKGHIGIAETVMNQCGLDHIAFIPCKIPVHRDTPTATEQQRLVMLELALQNQPSFSIDRIELERSSPSYSIDTVKALRQQHPQEILCWIMGLDAFAKLHTWHQHQEILNHCHLIIAQRPHSHLAQDNPNQELLKNHGTTDLNQLQSHAFGKIYHVDSTAFDICATDIRHHINDDTVKANLPQDVFDYITENQLYR